MADPYASLLANLDRISGRAATRCGDALAGGAVEQSGGGSAPVFARAGELRQQTRALQAAVETEEQAENAAEDAELRFREVQDDLVEAARQARRSLGGQDPRDAIVRQAVTVIDRGLEAWLDPYASEAAGAEELDDWERDLDQLPEALSPFLAPLRSTMQAARQAGADWDAAESVRVRALAARVEQDRLWRDAVRRLAAVAGTGPWLSPLMVGLTARSADETWFEEDEE